MHNSHPRRILHPLLLLVLFLIQSCAPVTVSTTDSDACLPSADLQNPNVQAMSSILANVMDKYKLSAVIFSAEQEGRPILRTALGYSTPGVPATTQMHFRIGAVGWQYLTALLLLMVDQKQIALSDPVSNWYPDYPNADKATVRMLAASSAGFGDYITKAFDDEVGANPLRFWAPGDLIGWSLPPYQTTQFDNPGKDWQYSHTGFVMLGAILEQVGKKPYTRLLKEMILDPLKLQNTRLQFDAKPQGPVLHTLEEDEFQNSTYWNPSWVSWAAMTSNVCDVGKWNETFGRGAMFSFESRKEITSKTNIGLGSFNTERNYFALGTIVNAPWIVQRASYWGMYTTTAYDPTSGISLVVTASLSTDSPPKISPANEIISEISKLFTPDRPIP